MDYTAVMDLVLCWIFNVLQRCFGVLYTYICMSVCVRKLMCVSVCIENSFFYKASWVCVCARACTKVRMNVRER